MDSPKPNLQGKLILDSGKLIGSFFDRTVILMCRHDDTGAFGLVVNRSTNQTLGSVVTGKIPKSIADMPLFVGGPVQPEMLSFLVETEADPQSEIAPWVTMGHSLRDLEQLFVSSKKPTRIRVFAGYSGWAAGQLEQEQEYGGWLNHPASASLVFHTQPQKLWQHILKLKGGVFSLMADSPDDPALN
jgi:putative transcriptional regulator